MKRKNDEMDDDPFFRDPNPDCYEETRDNLRDFIFGDRWLMGYCLEVAALAERCMLGPTR